MDAFMRTTPGITEPNLSVDPLATEGEATQGPNDWNPFDQTDPRNMKGMATEDDPTEGDDPYTFDDVGEEISSFNLPPIGNGPQF